MKDLALEWENAVWLSVVSACVGELDASTRAVWIEFSGGKDVVIHFQVDEVTPQVTSDTRDIADAVVPLMNPEDLGHVTRELHLNRPQISSEEILKYRWIYLQKAIR